MDLAINKLSWLIFHKTKQNKTKLLCNNNNNTGFEDFIILKYILKTIHF